MRNRKVQILFRLTDDEAEQLHELVRKSGRSREAFLREMVKGLSALREARPRILQNHAGAVRHRQPYQPACGEGKRPRLCGYAHAERGSEEVARVSNRHPKEVPAPAGHRNGGLRDMDVQGRLDHPIDYAETQKRPPTRNTPKRTCRRWAM